MSQLLQIEKYFTHENILIFSIIIISILIITALIMTIYEKLALYNNCIDVSIAGIFCIVIIFFYFEFENGIKFQNWFQICLFSLGLILVFYTIISSYLANYSFWKMLLVIPTKLFLISIFILSLIFALGALFQEDNNESKDNESALSGNIKNTGTKLLKAGFFAGFALLILKLIHISIKKNE